MPHGRCDKCQVRWKWNGRPRVADALCLCCHEPLKATSLTSLLKCYSAYAVRGFDGGPRHLTADSAEISKLRRDLKKKRLAAQLFGNLSKKKRSATCRP